MRPIREEVKDEEVSGSRLWCLLFPLLFAFIYTGRGGIWASRRCLVRNAARDTRPYEHMSPSITCLIRACFVAEPGILAASRCAGCGDPTSLNGSAQRFGTRTYQAPCRALDRHSGPFNDLMGIIVLHSLQLGESSKPNMSTIRCSAAIAKPLHGGLPLPKRPAPGVSGSQQR